MTTPQDTSALFQEPLRFPLLVTAENRDASTSRDAKLVNGYVEMVGGRNHWVYKRPGLKVNATRTAAAGMGTYNWRGNLYEIWGGVLYENGSVVATGLDTTGGVYTFSVSLGSTPMLFMQNGVAMYVHDVNENFTTIPVSSPINTTATLTVGSANLTLIPDISGILVGASVTGPGVPANQVVLSKTVVGGGPGGYITIGTAISSVPLIYSYDTEVNYSSGTGYLFSNLIPLTPNIIDTRNIAIGATVYSNTPTYFVFIPTVSNIVSATQVLLGTTTAFPITSTFTAPLPTLKFLANVTPLVPILIVNPGFSSGSFVKGSAYLDGGTYVLAKNGYVDGSAINDPTTWPTINSIAAQIEPEAGVFMTKQLTYILALKQYSIEVFYDAGASPGSPLAATPGLKVSIGCRHADSVQTAEGTLFFIGQTRDGSCMVVMMEGMKAVRVSTPAIEKILQAGDYTTVYSWIARINGHRFYGVTLKLSNITLVFDMDTQQWAQWTDPNGNYFPIVASTHDNSQVTLMQHESNGKIYALDASTYSDDSVVFPVDVYTPNWDGGTRRKKYLKLIDFISDQTIGGMLQVRCSDDDYLTWSTFRPVDLSMRRPYLTDCGTFRRRAYHIHHFANTPMRLHAMELQVALGTL